MGRPLTIAAIVPALDEEETVAGVVAALHRAGVATVIVVDNGSRDRTAARARAAGAEVVQEPERGYGAACLAGIAALPAEIDVVVFADADGSDEVEALPELVGPIDRGVADLVLGARVAREPGALSWPQRLGNRIATTALAALYGVRHRDLGPFRAIRRDALARLHMRDRGFGWTVEMQGRAALRGLRVQEHDVGYRRRRGGRSKISRDLRGSVRAGTTILWVLATLRVRAALESSRA